MSETLELVLRSQVDNKSLGSVNFSRGMMGRDSLKDTVEWNSYAELRES